MAEWLREWLTENPFLRLQGKRWLRNEGPWWTLFRGTAMPAALVLLLHLLYQATSPAGRVWLDRPFSLVLVSVLAFFHVLGVWGGGSPTLSLDEEAREHRLHFLRLLPLSSREFLFKLGLARAALRLPSLLAPLPVYFLIFLYGHPPLRILSVLYLLLLLLSLGLPSPGEVNGALQHAEGWSPGQETEAGPAGRSKAAHRPLPTLWRALGAYGLLLVLLMGAAARVRPGSSFWLDGLARAVGAFGEHNWVLDLLRLVGEPRPFFQWEVAPLWLFLAYWSTRGLLRLHEAAQLWGTGPEPEPEEDPNAGEPADRPEREPPDFMTRLRVSLQNLAFPCLLFLLVGFLWPWWIESGRLGTLVGQSTPAGGVTALLLIGLLLIHSIFLEVLRCGRDGEERSTWRTIRSAGLAWGQSAAAAVLFVLLAGLAGGVFPLADMMRVLPGLLASAGVTFGFGLGWRYFRNRMLLGPAGPLTTVLRGMLHAWAWLATYLLPGVALFGVTADPQTHQVAAVSPLYLLLCQFSPVRAASPVPPWMPWTLPLLAGATLALVVLRRPLPPGDPVTPERDPAMAALHRAAAAWDNAVFSVSLRRRSLRDGALTVRLIRAPLVMGVISILGAVFYALHTGRSSGQPFPAVLEIPANLPGLNLGAQTGLMAAAGTLTLGFLFGASLTGSIGGEGLGASHRQQRQDLRLSPMSNGEIVRGTLWVAVIEVLPTFGAGLAASLLWVGMAVLFGAGWYWVPVWTGAAAVVVGLILYQGLDAFRGWPRNARNSSWRSLGAGLGLVLLIGVVFLAAAGHALGLGPYLPVLLSSLALLGGALTLAQLPTALRHAERWVKASREEDADAPLN